MTPGRSWAPAPTAPQLLLATLLDGLLLVGAALAGQRGPCLRRQREHACDYGRLKRLLHRALVVAAASIALRSVSIGRGRAIATQTRLEREREGALFFRVNELRKTLLRFRVVNELREALLWRLAVEQSCKLSCSCSYCGGVTRSTR